MTIDELIQELTEIKERNYEPEVPQYDPGTLEVFVQSEEGIFESPILQVNQANDVWLIVKEDDSWGA